MDFYKDTPTGRLTYRRLKQLLDKFNKEQLDKDVTVELPYEGEYFAGELLITSDNNPVLDDYHPVIRLITIN